MYPKYISLLLVIIERQRNMVKYLALAFEEAVVKTEKLEQVAEALGDDNRYYAGLVLGHCPDEDEALAHYFKNQGPAYYRLLHTRRENRKLLAARKMLAAVA